MPAWPGGECPDCGDYMPPNLITCQTCRALLNSDLQLGQVDIPEYVPLKEIAPEERETNRSSIISESPMATAVQVPLVPVKGIFVGCPGCQEELKIPEQYAYSRVQCNHCQQLFAMDKSMRQQPSVSCYVDCPHCQRRLRASVEYSNQNVACNHCGGALHMKYEP
ncbi:MAG: hypothetical protein ACE37I_02075 [Rubinisphaera brasiliensis]|uniref:DZANK-type domain-containing protein n=1 Tax=Rubinisphaera brasiliensis (strain ATCC 49424 / DSM 5305 / JCM 21570 / IAM 15109 / NBRC 103401 / IFAM 1448) TaxID=756272 RepID=F0SQV0_RUBBR|nr:hypothetical protein [Rubinisphaera brasiliensis]ADY60171.1 hypothetical protein Plabr_2571 [Rubinisphaera brasiliensis DSM 5305]MBB02904.1 hypothetical protein [Planctomyces sp.]